MKKQIRKKLRHRMFQRLRKELFRGIEPKLTALLQMQLRERIAEYQALVKSGAPLPSLADVEWKVFSQNGEDGILLYLLSLTGWEQRRFLEIGIQDGWECNCANLAKHLFWEGWFVEGNPADAGLAAEHFRTDPSLQNRDIRVISQYVTRENINAMLAENGIGEVDLFSLDIDGMDWWIWKEMRDLRPRVVVMEYNSAFGPQREVTVAYRPTFDRKEAHRSKLYYGASLPAFEKLGREKGYRFVGVNSSGVNAFFVREDAAPDTLKAVPVAEAFRENTAQRGFGSHEDQFEKIRHLQLVEV